MERVLREGDSAITAVTVSVEARMVYVSSSDGVVTHWQWRRGSFDGCRSLVPHRADGDGPQVTTCQVRRHGRAGRCRRRPSPVGRVHRQPQQVRQGAARVRLRRRHRARPDDDPRTLLEALLAIVVAAAALVGSLHGDAEAEAHGRGTSDWATLS